MSQSVKLSQRGKEKDFFHPKFSLTLFLKNGRFLIPIVVTFSFHLSVTAEKLAWQQAEWVNCA